MKIVQSFKEDISMDKVFLILGISVFQLVSLLGVVIAGGFILGVLRNQSIKYLFLAFGKIPIVITGIIGTPIHEIGHAIMCVLFRHKIIKIKLFNFGNNSNVLGYVEHGYNKKSPYQRIGNLFIALGPIFSGIFVMLLSLYFLLPDSYNFLVTGYTNNIKNSDFTLSLSYFTNFIPIILDFIKSIIFHFNTIQFWIYIFLVFSISLHISLSSKDMDGFLDGFISISILTLVLNTIFVQLNINISSIYTYINMINTYTFSIMLVSIVFSLITYIFSTLLYRVFK
jgi:hypothetical protein